MTTNQIAFAKLQEEIRHNQLTEAQARNELLEAKRHSVVTESEAGRHNTATEMEAQRHNVINEQETQRANLAQEGLKREAQLETHRSNLEQERLKGEAQSEQHRANLMSERLRQEDVWNEQSKIAETSRHNLIMESTIPAEKAKLSAEASYTQARIPGALADATYTNVNADYTISKKKGQDIENKYAPAKNISEIGSNWSKVWYNILRGVGTGIGTATQLMPAFNLIK